MSVVYEGYSIFVKAILGSGQKLYGIKGIDELSGKSYTLISAAKEAIDKFLGQYVEEDIIQSTMTEEQFAQLQAGTLAQWELEQLKEKYNAAVDKINSLIGQVAEMSDMSSGYREQIANLQNQIANMTKQVQDMISQTNETIGEVGDISGDVEGLTDTINGMISKLNDQIKSLTESKESFIDTTDIIEGITDTMNDVKKMIEDFKGFDLFGGLGKSVMFIGIGLVALFGIVLISKVD